MQKLLHYFIRRFRSSVLTKLYYKKISNEQNKKQKGLSLKSVKDISIVLKKAKISHFNFHSLRHTFATNCISLGVDYKTVSELLGRSNINITLNLYVHPIMKDKKKCVNRVWNIHKRKD